MSSHESRESRADEPLEPDRPIPPNAAPSAADDVVGRRSSSGASDSDCEDEVTLAEATEAPWDAGDPRRRRDSFAPPTEPCQCHCLHCGRTFSSEGIWFQKVINDPQGFGGFWMCPTPNCSGAGFTFDIFPTDPDHPANEGWHYDDDEFDDEDEFEDEEDTLSLASVDGGGDLSEPALDAEDADEYDPAEPHYKDMDDFFGDEEDDLDGEEWKQGLQPGERPPEPAWRQDARREWEEDQKMYDEPDQRPRVLDWSDREDRKDENYYHPPLDGKFSDDDIPF